jgi:HEXXH motif-containing protein
MDRDRVAAILGDPYAALWTRLAFALCGAVLRGEPVPPAGLVFARECESDDPAELLRRHLEQYKRLALGAAVLADAKLELANAFDAELPLALPGAAASLVGDGAARITGAADGRTLLESGAAELRACPRARVGALSLPLQPHGWRVPGIGWMPSAGRTTLEFQAENVPLVESGLRLIEQHQPELFAQMSAVLRWIAVNPLSEYDGMNYVSYSELPGAFSFRGIAHPYSAAEASIHEFHHNRLFRLEERGPWLEGERLGTDDDAGFYSPWREELRPLRGVLHGVYVTAAQLRFWLEFARSATGDAAHFARVQLVRQPLVIELGLGQLARHARFTPAGAELVAELSHDAATLAAAARELGAPRDIQLVYFAQDGGLALADPPRTAREDVLAHVRAHDRLRQIPEAWLAENAPD